MNKIRSFFSFLNTKQFVQLEDRVTKAFSKLPRMPKEIEGLIVSFGPYLVLLGGILGVLSVLTLFSIGNLAFYPVYVNAVSILPFYYLTIISSVITGVMMIVSFSDLQKRTIFGWRLVFWSFTISVITMLITLNIISAVVSAVVSFYILVSIKENYNN